MIQKELREIRQILHVDCTFPTINFEHTDAGFLRIVSVNLVPRGSVKKAYFFMSKKFAFVLVEAETEITEIQYVHVLVVQREGGVIPCVHEIFPDFDLLDSLEFRVLKMEVQCFLIETLMLVVFVEIVGFSFLLLSLWLIWNAFVSRL